MTIQEIETFAQPTLMDSMMAEYGVDLADVEVVQDDYGQEVDFIETVHVFFGQYVGSRAIPMTRPDGEEYIANLYKMAQLSSVMYNGSPEIGDKVNGEYPPIPKGAARAVWGNYQIDEAMSRAKMGDFVYFEFVRKGGTANRPVNLFKIAIKHQK